MKRCLWLTSVALAVSGLVAGCGEKHDEATGSADGGTAADGHVGDGSLSTGPLTLTGVSPTVIDPIGGSRLKLTGSGLLGSTSVTVGGIAVSAINIVSDSQVEIVTSAIAADDGLDVVVARGTEEATLLDAVESWSPAQISGARLFDAASGVEQAEASFTYEWQRLTDNIHDDWRVRDGNTLSWLPSTNKFWMVGGWNGWEVPNGFSSVPEGQTVGLGWETTTNEVWSSPDLIHWTLELEHNHDQWQRRHAHNTLVWNDALWVVGGDAWQGFHNHDVLTSPDGVNWTVVLGEYAGKAAPPWEQRDLQMAGVYDGKLWMAGGVDLRADTANPVAFNDVWVTEDGEHWTEVAPDAPASATRWRPCGVMTELVEFNDRLWMVGCGIYDETNGFEYFNEVWSTTDGVTWTQHATPPWDGKLWHNVLVWDDKIWTISGSSETFPNGSETWFTEDGETWTALESDRCQQPGSHAQGVTSRADGIYYAGGNYSFGHVDMINVDKSTWRLVKFEGAAVRGWTDRGTDGLVATAPTERARPLLVADAFGEGAPGLQFDGSKHELVLDEVDLQASGRSVFWVARAPFLRTPGLWDDTYAPNATVVGGEVGGLITGGVTTSAAGLTNGQVVYSNQAEALGPSGEAVYEVTRAGEGLQHAAGEVRLAGVTHSTDGTVQAWVDGQAQGSAGHGYYAEDRGWTRLGAGIAAFSDSYFAGTLGAVVIAPSALDTETIEKMHQWAMGRFGAP